MNAARLAAMLVCAFAATAHAAPTITGIAISNKNIARGQAMTVTVKGDDLEKGICALRISYGDGTSTLRHMDWGKNVRFPITVKKTYDKVGKYSISVTGVKSGKVLQCLGSARTPILVTEPPVAP